jgi:hypothetical protein
MGLCVTGATPTVVAGTAVAVPLALTFGPEHPTKAAAARIAKAAGSTLR